MATFEQFRKSFPDQSYAKGKKFEDFLRDFLQNKHPFYSKLFVKVWPFRQFPKRWHNKPDLGTDLVAEDREGRICAIQVKFFGKEYTIPKGEVDSFLTDSNVKIVDYRLLIASTDKIGLNAIVAIETQEKPVQTFLLSDLEKWTDWPRSINSAAPKRKFKPKKPRDYQRAAIKAVVGGLDKRGQLIMACGTGKTLTSQRIAEGLESKTTLVVVPSLLLLAQTLDDWVANGEVDFDFLAVCSDSTVTRRAEDRVEFRDSDCGFLVAKTEDEIGSFLSKPGKKAKVIFSTYASCPKVAGALRKLESASFDLLIADEAHQCAGIVSNSYSTVLSQERLPARKRLFMTATPRVFSSGIKNLACERDLDVVSMDEESVFGPVLHKLSFGQAIKHKPPILTDYQVVIIGVASEEVSEAIKKRELVNFESGFSGDAAQLAAMVGLSMAMRKYGLRRTISFHSRISRARDFSKEFSKLTQVLKESKKAPGQVNSHYVSGAMSATARNERLRQLANVGEGQSYLLCNARCLAEGVDVKAIDSVSFADPKRSQVEIIQAVGRAIRLSNEKKVGTIVLPVFIKNSNNELNEPDFSGFENVWQVINALRSHDEELGLELDQLRIQLGKNKKVSFIGSKIVFDLPKSVGPKFIESLNVQILNNTTESWNFYYGCLLAHANRTGSARIPHRYVSEDGVYLGVWCDTQRVKYSKNRLSEHQVKLLNDLEKYGWYWKFREQHIERSLHLLREFYKREGHALIAPKHKNRYSKEIRNAIRFFRKTKATGTLTPDIIQLLENELDFVWDVDKFFWLHQYRGLRRAYRAGPNINRNKQKVKINISKTKFVFRNLVTFRSRIVTRYRRAKLHDEINPLSDRLIKSIEKIPNWSWLTKSEERFKQNCKEVKKYIGNSGNFRLSSEVKKVLKNPALYQWYYRISNKISLNLLTPMEKFILVENGLLQEPKKSAKKENIVDFDTVIAELKKFYKRENHYQPERHCIQDGYDIGTAVSEIRKLFWKQSSEQSSSLSWAETFNSLGCTWIWVTSMGIKQVSRPLNTIELEKCSNYPSASFIGQLLRLGICCGFKIEDFSKAEVIQKDGIQCFSIPGRNQSCKRIIPIPQIYLNLLQSEEFLVNKKPSRAYVGKMWIVFKANEKLWKSLHHLSLASTFRNIIYAHKYPSLVANSLIGWGSFKQQKNVGLPELKKHIDHIAQAIG